MSAKQVALIEDEAKLLDLLIFNLNDDFSIKGYKDAESFLDDFDPENVGVVVTDVRLPGMDGLALLEHLNKNAPHIPVIIITAFGSINQAVTAIKQGAYDYLTKPVSIDALEEVISRANQFSSNIDPGAPPFPEDSQFLTQDPATLKQCELAARASPMKIPVLILGATGTGKELIAEMIHKASKREGNLVKINCAAIPNELLEGELFGYKKGAFTGADASYEGKLRLSDGGTLFLDEIGDMNEALQAKVLRVIETESFYPIGENRLCTVDLRIIAATNKDLRQEVERGTFRSDLYYRLAVVPIRIPPLPERPDDIKVIAQSLFQQLQESGRTNAKAVDESVYSLLTTYSWPGNVRELRNVMTNMALLSSGKKITAKDLPQELISSKNQETQRTDGIPETYEELKRKKKEIKNEAYAELEINFIRNALMNNDWNISKTAEAVGIDRRLLQNMIKKYNIRKEEN